MPTANWTSCRDWPVKLRVDVILTGGSNDATAAKNATQTIPIVFSGAVSDPVGAGLVSSLARPGGNITGFTTIATDLSGKRLKLLKDAVPKLGRVAVLWDPRNAAAAPQWKEHQLAAKALGVPLHSMVVSSLDRYESAFQEAAKAGSAALSVLQGALAGTSQKTIVDLAAKYRWPAMYYRRDFVEMGGMMSYSADREESVRRTAAILDKILKGTKPADIPVEQPTRFEMVINLRTATRSVSRSRQMSWRELTKSFDELGIQNRKSKLDDS